MERTVLRCKDLDEKYDTVLEKLFPSNNKKSLKILARNKRSFKTLDGLFKEIDNFLYEYDFVRPFFDVSLVQKNKYKMMVLSLCTIDTDLSNILPPIELAGFEERADGKGWFESSCLPIISGRRIRNKLIGLVVLMSTERPDLLPATGTGLVVKTIRESLGPEITEVSLSDNVSLYYRHIRYGKYRIVVQEPTRSGMSVKRTTYESVFPELELGSVKSNLRAYHVNISKVSQDSTGLLDAAYELTEKLSEEN